MGGYGKSSSSKPYILMEEGRRVLFPKAPRSAVVDPETSQQVLASAGANVERVAEGLLSMDLALEEMPDVTGKGSEVGDPLELSNPSHAASDSSALSEGSSFTGFSGAMSQEHTLAPPS